MRSREQENKYKKNTQKNEKWIDVEIKKDNIKWSLIENRLGELDGKNNE